MIIDTLEKLHIITPPKWLATNCCYLTQMGSVAYGVSSDNSDMDIYGFCIPPKEDVFPHLRGEILGFGRNVQRFEQWQQHHIFYQDGAAGKGQNYDFQVFNIVKLFQLLLENNPNIIDCIFTPVNCILHINQIGQLVRDNRKMFLHKGCWHKFRGYAYSQLHKIEGKPVGKRIELWEKYGYDTKFAYHVIRLIGECTQILTEGDIDLQRDNERLKAIRRGEWTLSQIKDWFSLQEKYLEELYHNSDLPHSPDESRIKKLLCEALEIHYGSLENCVVQPNAAISALRNIQSELNKVQNLLST